MHFTVITTQDIDIERYCYDTENLDEEYIEKIIQCPKGEALKICKDMLKRDTKTMKEHPEFKWNLSNLEKAIEGGEEACKEYLKESDCLQEDDEGNLYQEENPYGIYDWCSVGGRWTGYFKAKEGKSGEVSDYGGVFDRQAPAGYYDEIAKKDIDLAGMFKEHVHNLKEKWNNAQKFIKQYPDFKGLDEIKGKDWEEKRSKYNAQKGIVKMSEFLGWDGDLKYYRLPLNDYIKLFKDNCILPSGFIDKEGEYYTNEDWIVAGDNYKESFWEWYNSLDDEDILVIYDCHT